MKLTRRQKKIILASTIAFFLVLAAIVSTVLLVNKDQKKSSEQIPGSNDSPTDNSNLLQTKTQTITLLGVDLSADNIRKEDLLTELKNSNYLTADKTNWEDYINEATTPEEVKERESNIKVAINKLKETPGPTGPGPTGPGPTGPGPTGPGPTGPGPTGPGPTGPGPTGPGPTGPGPSGIDPWLHIEDIENAYQEIGKNVNQVELLIPPITQVIQNAVRDIATMSVFDKQAHKATANEYKTKDIIFLPVNNSSTGGYQGGTGSHWSLLVYRKDNKFYYYDSAGSMNLSAATKLAENFLQYLEISGSADINQPTPCPQQSNGSDCGVFTIAFTRCLANKFKNNLGAIDQADFWKITENDFEFPIAEERKKADQKNPNRRPF